MYRLRIFVFLLTGMASVSASGQISENINLKDSFCESHLDSLITREVYSISEVMPQPQGGMDNLYKQLSKNINYPEQKIERIGIELSKIFIGFVVDVDGSIIGKRIIKNTEGTNIAEQMLDTIDALAWIPGYCDDKPVPVILVIPIQICLR